MEMWPLFRQKLFRFVLQNEMEQLLAGSSSSSVIIIVIIIRSHWAKLCRPQQVAAIIRRPTSVVPMAADCWPNGPWLPEELRTQKFRDALVREMAIHAHGERGKFCEMIDERYGIFDNETLKHCKARLLHAFHANFKDGDPLYFMSNSEKDKLRRNKPRRPRPRCCPRQERQDGAQMSNDAKEQNEQNELISKDRDALMLKLMSVKKHDILYLWCAELGGNISVITKHEPELPAPPGLSLPWDRIRRNLCRIPMRVIRVESCMMMQGCA